MDRKPLIVFDFDGVIADTRVLADGILAGFLPSVSAIAFEDTLSGTFSPSLWARALRSAYKAYFVVRYVRGLKPGMVFPGAKDMIDGCAEVGDVVVLTSGLGGTVKRFLALSVLDGPIQAVYSTQGIRPKGRELRRVLEKRGYKPAEAVLITDTLGDLKEAAAEGVKTVAVTWGYQGVELLKQGGPSAIATQPGEVAKSVRNLLA